MVGMASRRGPKPPKPPPPSVADAETIGDRIVALYIAKGFNRHSLSHKLGVAYTTVIAWEENKNAPRGENLQKLSVALGVPSSVILGEERPMTEAQYEVWAAFLETSTGQGMIPSERRALGSMRFDADDPVTIARYTALLYALRGTRAAS